MTTSTTSHIATPASTTCVDTTLTTTMEMGHVEPNAASCGTDVNLEIVVDEPLDAVAINGYDDTGTRAYNTSTYYRNYVDTNIACGPRPPRSASLGSLASTGAQGHCGSRLQQGGAPSQPPPQGSCDSQSCIIPGTGQHTGDRLAIHGDKPGCAFEHPVPRSRCAGVMGGCPESTPFTVWQSHRPPIQLVYRRVYYSFS